MLFPPGTVALLAALNAEDLPHRAQVVVPTSASAPGGERATTWAVARTLPCRLRAIGLSPDERLTADQLAARDQYRVVFAAGADLAEAHRLTVTGTDVAGRAWSLALEVVSIAAYEMAETQRTALCVVVSS